MSLDKPVFGDGCSNFLLNFHPKCSAVFRQWLGVWSGGCICSQAWVYIEMVPGSIYMTDSQLYCGCWHCQAALLMCVLRTSFPDVCS